MKARRVKISSPQAFPEISFRFVTYKENLLNGQTIEITGESKKHAQEIRNAGNTAFRRWLPPHKKLQTAVREKTAFFLMVER